MKNKLLPFVFQIPTLKSIGYRLYIGYILISLLFLSGCSSYKSTWDCPVQHGIGCSTIEYADEIAREQIKFNKINKKQNILFNPDVFGIPKAVQELGRRQEASARSVPVVQDEARVLEVDATNF